MGDTVGSTGGGDSDSTKPYAMRDCRLDCDCKGVRCKGIPKKKKRCGCRCRCRNDPKAYDLVTEEGRIEILMQIM